MPMPLCADCARGKYLCKRCQAEFDAGLISEYDIETARAMHAIFGAEADFKRAIDTPSHVIIVVKADNVGGVIGRGGENIRKLAERLGKPARIVGDGSVKEMAEALIAPAKVKGINVVIEPSGVKKTRVHISKAERHLLRMDLEALRKLISAVSDEKVEIILD